MPTARAPVPVFLMKSRRDSLSCSLFVILLPSEEKMGRECSLQESQELGRIDNATRQARASIGAKIVRHQGEFRGSCARWSPKGESNDREGSETQSLREFVGQRSSQPRRRQ